MKFKRDWKVIFRDFYCLYIFIFLVLLGTVYIPLIRNGEFLALLYCFSVYLFVMFFGFLSCYLSGEFTNYIILDDSFITLQQKKQLPLKICWDEVDKILRTRYIGGKAIVFWDKYGRKIWFYSSKRLDEYILSNHPELEPLFPAKNDVRKWEQWDKKLRF